MSGKREAIFQFAIVLSERPLNYYQPSPIISSFQMWRVLRGSKVSHSNLGWKESANTPGRQNRRALEEVVVLGGGENVPEPLAADPKPQKLADR